MNEELKPVRCGCGGEADSYMSFTYEYYVMCHMCGTRTDYYTKEAEAIQAWNRAMGADQFRELTKKIERTAKVNVHYRDESVVFGFCECGQAVNTYSTYCPNCGARLEWE